VSRTGRRTIFGGTPFKEYTDLPKNYKDHVGLPFRRKDLVAHEVITIFGPMMDTDKANHLLRVMHGRRVAGTLDDPEVQINTIEYTEKQKEDALKYLRHIAPVDEVINAGLRAEDELRALEEGNTADVEGEKEGTENLGYGSRFKVYKEAEQEDDVYGPSALDKIRKRNEARWQAQKARQEEERRLREEEEAKANPGGLAKIDRNAPRQLSPALQKWADKATSDLKEPPQMSAWERLMPSTVFVALLVAGFAAYAQFYEPPEQENRLWPDYSPSTATVGALIMMNIAAFCLWRVPPAWGLMNKYFMVVAATPKPFSMVGAIFSHQAASHLLMNTVFLWYLGTKLHDEVGRGDFLATYFAAGSIGFLATLYSLVLARRFEMMTLGLSGAFYGVATAYFWLHRFDGFKILGLPPDPASGIQGLGFIGLMLALNIAAVFSKNHRMDYYSHIGGMAVGLACGALMERRKKAGVYARHAPFHTETGTFVDKMLEKK
jgi:rhomboid-like protein